MRKKRDARGAWRAGASLIDGGDDDGASQALTRLPPPSFTYGGRFDGPTTHGYLIDAIWRHAAPLYESQPFLLFKITLYSQASASRSAHDIRFLPFAAYFAFSSRKTLDIF